MKKLILGIIFITFTFPLSAQKYVHVMKCDSISEELLTLSIQKTDWMFKIEPLLSTSKKRKDVNINKYYIATSKFQDTIQVINELMELEGDKRLLCTPLIGHSSISSSIRSKDTNISIQVYALYLIWGLLFDYNGTAKYSILTTKIDDEYIESSVDGIIVEKAFAAYKKWIDESNGDINYLRQNMPLENCSVRWVR